MIPCLSRALTHEQLINDIASMCAMSGISAKAIANGQHSPRELAAKLFLTENEASGLVKECLAQYEADPGERFPSLPGQMSAVHSLFVQPNTLPTCID